MRGQSRQTRRFWAGAAAAVLVVASLYAAGASLRSGIVFHHMASVRELAKGDWPPRHNLIAGLAPQGHYGPFMVGLGWVARVTGAPPLRVLEGAGLFVLLAYLVAFRNVTRAILGEQAASWAAVAPLLLWGPLPRAVVSWPAWGWPGTTSFADPHSFFHPQQAAVVVQLALLLTLLLDRSTAQVRSWDVAARAIALGALVISIHPLTGLALVPMVLALAGSDAIERGRVSARSILLLALLPAALALAAAWPHYPVLGLLRAFASPVLREPMGGVAGPAGALLQASAPPTPDAPILDVLGPALVGLGPCVALAWQRRPFLLLWTLANLGLSACPLLPLRQRFAVFAALPLQIAGAAALAALWDKGRVGRASAAILLVAGAASAAQRIAWILDQEAPNLAFVERATPEDAVVLSDPRTSNAVAGLTGRKIVAPEGPDLFLVLSGGWQRNVDAARFFKEGASPAERDEILRRWRATHVLQDRLAGGTTSRLAYPVVVETGGYVLYDVASVSGEP
jgi:hypothetical protein